MVNLNSLPDIEQTLAGLLVDYWKLARAAGKATNSLPENDAKRLSSQVRYAEKQLQMASKQFGLRLIEFDGEDFNPGMAATADNFDEFDEETSLLVERTLEPTIVNNMRVVRQGRVLVSQKKM